MNDEIEPEKYEIKERSLSTIKINLDKFSGNGLKNIIVICNENEFIFSKDEIFRFFEYIKSSDVK